VVALGLAIAACGEVSHDIARHSQLPPLYVTGKSLRQQYLHGRIPLGAAAFRIEIPRFGVDATVVQGTTSAALQAGAGHYVTSPLPGGRGNVAVFGHRTYYGRPFADLDQLRPGDVVTTTTPVGVERYVVVPPFSHHGNPWVVTAPDYAVVSNARRLALGHWLTLVADSPSDGGPQWVVVRLRLAGA
jgi:sortase A